MKAGRRGVVYGGAIGLALIVSLMAAWTPLAGTIDNAAYDWMFALHEPRAAMTETALLAIDEASLAGMRGRRNLRCALGEALERVAAVGPRAVAIDLILTEPGTDEEDACLERGLRVAPRLVLGADIPQTRGWEFPLERFAVQSKAVGHVHADPDPVSRHLPLMKAQGRRRLWAMSLEAYRLVKGVAIVETPRELEVGERVIPALPETARAMRIRYRDGQSLPRVTLAELRADPEKAKRFTGRVVLVGFTAQSEVKDRLMTPLGDWMAGVEIHAHAYETIAAGRFLTDAPNWVVVLVSLGIALGAVWVFRGRPDWRAYALGGVLLLVAHLTPHVAYRQDIVFPTFAPVSTAWLAVVTAAVYQYFVARRQLQVAETDRERYKQAIHFVAHEMRTPLTAIQGSSELMSRYSLNVDKQKQMAEMINAESKRLARMITTFLNIERLSDGSTDLKRDPFGLEEAVAVCVERARVLAERKRMRIEVGEIGSAMLTGDRELMEYAIYNLLTNAVKYSPEETVITVNYEGRGAEGRLSVRDQGMGMDEKELKSIFDKFYRTKRAEAAGIEGTGIGLSLVNEIVGHHQGRIEVTSEVGRGSCFTLVLPVTDRIPTTIERA